MPSTIYPPIRTFHARHGRLSASHRAALEDRLPALEVTGLPAPVSMQQLLPGRTTVLDFGCGSGIHALELLERGCAVLAVDVHAPGIARLAESNSSHLKLHLGDGVALVRERLAPHSLDEVHVMFPDPWPKARHHKRRLVQHAFLSDLRRVLVPGGLLAVVTDDDSYAEHVAEVLPSAQGWFVTHEEFSWEPTRYHERAMRLGHEVHSFTARTSSH